MLVAQRKNATSNAKMEMFQHLYGQMERRFQKVHISVKEDQTGSHERVKSHVRNNVLILNTIIKDNPLLTTRKIKGQNPTRLIIDPSLKLTNKY